MVNSAAKYIYAVHSAKDSRTLKSALSVHLSSYPASPSTVLGGLQITASRHLDRRRFFACSQALLTTVQILPLRGDWPNNDAQNTHVLMHIWFASSCCFLTVLSDPAPVLLNYVWQTF